SAFCSSFLVFWSKKFNVSIIIPKSESIYSTLYPLRVMTAYISNPDLVQRFEHGWPLAPDADPTVWNGGERDYGVGYTDFPAYSAP
ncbi:MAG: hypothetical protein RLZZ490_2250, partial [Cyanobacteriota bacterium]